ncbi:MAG: hypothetical protein ABIG61_07415 [Planctomycetota bacterium]
MADEIGKTKESRDSEMKITIDVSEENEGTDSPYWLIINPRQNFRVDDQSIHDIASMITGPFFSREAAQLFLNVTRYNFGTNPRVFCASGHPSRQYREAWRKADREKLGE